MFENEGYHDRRSTAKLSVLVVDSTPRCVIPPFSMVSTEVLRQQKSRIGGELCTGDNKVSYY